MFEGWDKAQVVIAAILIAVATAIGTILCYIPGLVVGFLTIFTILFVVDKQLTAVDAIKASFELVTKNFGNTSCSGSWPPSRCSSARCCAASGCWSPLRWC